MFTTAAYQKEALRLLIEEANRVAKELNLPAKPPITETDIVHAYIVPFGDSWASKSIGNIATKHYWYNTREGHKLSHVTIADYDRKCFEFRDKYQWHISRIDTNAAYQLATQWLAAMSVDVNALNRECTPHVALSTFWNNVSRLGEMPKGTNFVPIYYVWWTPKGDKAGGFGGASVELLLPTKTLIALGVDDQKYLLRKPLVFTNLAALFPKPTHQSQ